MDHSRITSLTVILWYERLSFPAFNFLNYPAAADCTGGRVITRDIIEEGIARRRFVLHKNSQSGVSDRHESCIFLDLFSRPTLFTDLIPLPPNLPEVPELGSCVPGRIEQFFLNQNVNQGPLEYS